VPFDIGALRYIYYDPNNPFWGENLRSELTRVIRAVLETPSLAAHLAGVSVHAPWPEAPNQSLRRVGEEIAQQNFTGVWNTSWLSIKREREHKATLVIPPDHGRNFMASITVSYTREEQETQVQETLSGIAEGSHLSLNGVNFTYLKQGSSRSYSLDSFELQLANDGKALIGNAILKHGTREVKFKLLTDLKNGRQENS
jgi:hypothetical protein